MLEQLSEDSLNRIEDYLDQTCAPLVRVKARPERAAIREELRSHLVALVRAGIELGETEASALRRALRNMGPPARVSRAFGTRKRAPWAAILFAISLINLGASLYLAGPRSVPEPRTKTAQITALNEAQTVTHRLWAQAGQDCRTCHADPVAPARFVPPVSVPTPTR